MEGITLTSGTNTHNLAFQFGNASGVANYGNNVTLSTAANQSGTSNLTTPFVIASGGSRTFYVYLNSANTNSTHTDLRFTVNGIPEPSSALLGGIGFLALLRRRRA